MQPQTGRGTEMQVTKTLRPPGLHAASSPRSAGSLTAAVNGVAIPQGACASTSDLSVFVSLPGATPDPLFKRHPIGRLFQHTVRHRGWHPKEAPGMPEVQTRQWDQGAENSQKGCFLFEMGCFPIFRKPKNRQSTWEVMGASQNRKEKHEKE